jgi:hypothetical protein
MISLAALVNLNHPAHYFSFGPFSISVGNAVVILAMIVIFILALFLPFPGDRRSESGQEGRGVSGVKGGRNR